MKTIIRKETVSLQCYSQALVGNQYVQSFRFKDNENLRNVKIWGVQTYYQNIFPYSLDFPIGYPQLPTKSQFRRLFLNLYDTKGINFLHTAPFVIFQSIENGTLFTNKYAENSTIQEKDFKYFKGQKLDLQNSSVEYISNKAEQFTIVVDIYYSRIDIDKI